MTLELVAHSIFFYKTRLITMRQGCLIEQVIVSAIGGSRQRQPRTHLNMQACGEGYVDAEIMCCFASTLFRHRTHAGSGVASTDVM